MTGTRVLIADPQRMVAEALAIALRHQADPGFDVIDEHPASGGDLIRAVTAHEPDVVITEYWLVDMAAPAAIQSVHARRPDLPVLVLAWLPGVQQIKISLEAGACGFLPKSAPLARLVEALGLAQQGVRPIFAEELEHFVSMVADRTRISEQAAKALCRLAPRELEVLRLLGSGLHVADVADRLELAETTVRGYVSNILQKTGTQSQVEIIALARDQGFLH